MELIQLNISALRQSDSQNNAYVLLLNETIGERQLPIVVGWCEARSIAVALDNKEKPERPLTHDLFKAIGDKFSISVSKIVIHKLNEGVFHSTLYFKHSITKKEIEIDSRTSDAIAIAIRFSCPIFTYEDILSRASILTVSSYNKESGKSNIIENTDIMIVRELTGGIYFGEPRGFDKDRAWNTLTYNRSEVERIDCFVIKFQSL